MSFTNFPLPGDHCVRLLAKNLYRQTPVSVVREELGALGITGQGVIQLRSEAPRPGCIEKPSPNSALYSVGGTGYGSAEGAISDQTLRSAILDGDIHSTKGPLKCKRCQRFGHTQAWCVACCQAHFSVECSTPQQQLTCCSRRGNKRSQQPSPLSVERGEGGACYSCTIRTRLDEWRNPPTCRDEV